MEKLVPILIACGLFGFALGMPKSFAQEVVPEISAMEAGAESPPPANYPVVRGVVRRINASALKITIKSDRIPNLDMPPMTMDFSVSDPKMLLGLAPGSRIRFCADQPGGVLTAIWIGKGILEFEGDHS